MPLRETLDRGERTRNLFHLQIFSGNIGHTLVSAISASISTDGTNQLVRRVPRNFRRGSNLLRAAAWIELSGPRLFRPSHKTFPESANGLSDTAEFPE